MKTLREWTRAIITAHDDGKGIDYIMQMIVDCKNELYPITQPLKSVPADIRTQLDTLETRLCTLQDWLRDQTVVDPQNETIYNKMIEKLFEMGEPYRTWI